MRTERHEAGAWEWCARITHSPFVFVTSSRPSTFSFAFFPSPFWLLPPQLAPYLPRTMMPHNEHSNCSSVYCAQPSIARL